jgi:hypothetical protein
MTDQSILCPHCGKKIQLTEALTHPIEEKLRKDFESENKRKEREHEAAIEALKKEQAQALAGERAAVEKAAKKRAEDALAQDMKDLKSQLEEKAKLLEDARKQELALRKREREIEERSRSLALDLERKLDEGRAKIREDALTKAAEEHHLRDREKDKQLEDMRKQIEDLKRKAEQGSQQAQGEVQELALEEILRSSFRFDEIEPVAKGVRGADALQRVRSSSGKTHGSILWESKRTKAWSDAWVQKLKDDMREAKADFGVIVSSVLPKCVSHIGQYDGVWVTDFPSLVGLSTALRAGITQLAQAQNALAGKGEKMELIYRYLSGPEFRHRVEAIVEAFVAMKTDLDSEKRAMERTWAKREKQIQRVIHNTSGMYGDLQGLIGASLAPIASLEMSSGGETSGPENPSSETP